MIILSLKADGWFGHSNSSNPMTNDQYIKAVQTSTVAVNINKCKALKAKTINKIRSQSKVKCLGIKTPCNTLVAPCLFDIEKDPCEENNLAALLPEKLNEILLKLNFQVSTATSTNYPGPGKYFDDFESFLLNHLL
mgnify:CR=1 FL=1